MVTITLTLGTLMQLLRSTMWAAVSFSAAWSAITAQAPAPAHSAVTPPSHAVLAARVDSLAAAFIADPQAPAVSISVIRAGRDTLVFKGYGVDDIEEGVTATPATVYRIGSITKQFTSAAVMRMVERGAVHLDDSVATYLTRLPEPWRRVTVRQLLNHTSGIPNYTDIGESWVRRWGEDMPPDTLVALTAHRPMDFAPGTRWKYDNTGYVLLGMLIEKVSGRPYAAYLDSTLFRPLGLTGTSYCYAAPIIPHRAQGYARSGHTYVNAPYLNMSQPFSAGALCSTVGDLARWNRALATGQVVTTASYRQMTTPEGAAARDHYGFGLVQDTLGGHAIIAHGGGINGFISYNAYLPDDSLSVTVLANAAPSNPDVLLRDVVRATLGLPIVKRPFVEFRAPPAVPLPAKVRAAVAGTYVLKLPARDLPIVIRSDSTGLTAEAAGQSAIPLIYIGDNTFGAAIDPTLKMHFIIESAGRVRMEFTQRGASSEATRSP
ncbi:MAG: serine hydrolase domain-containing protein [Gemmatimonadaceae bacterium]